MGRRSGEVRSADCRRTGAITSTNITSVRLSQSRSLFAFGVAVTILVAAFSIIYLPDIGRGFIKDDFRWLANARLRSWSSLEHVLLGSLGFYRPIVTLSFGVNELLFGLSPFGFGLTNFALALGACAALFALLRRLQVGAWAALAASALWAFNFHGINMALLWLSGRTALFLVLFSLLTVLSVLNRSVAGTFAFTLLALGSKEEAVVLPFMCAVFGALQSYRALTGMAGLWRSLLWSVPAFLALGLYAALRFQSGAFTPFNAPAFYTFQGTPSLVLRNILEYFDRSSTVTVAFLLLSITFLRQWSAARSVNSVLVVAGSLWWVAALALTMWLPVRSNLYALWPSVGTAIVAATFLDAAFRRADTEGLKRLAGVSLLIPFLLIPIYRTRNVRWVELADLSTTTRHAIDRHLPDLTEGTLIELIDNHSTRANFANTFGTLYPEASDLWFGDRHELWIVPPPAPGPHPQKPPLPTAAAFALQSNGIARVPLRDW